MKNANKKPSVEFSASGDIVISNASIVKDSSPSTPSMLIEKKDDRFYSVNGMHYPRVTWILSYFPQGEGLKRWLGNAGSYEEAEEKKNAAGLRGTNVHLACAALIEGRELSYLSYSEEEWGYIESFVNWAEDYKPVFISHEQRVISKKYMYAGTFDAIATIGDEMFLIDFKTSANIYPSFFCQLAAYLQAAKESKIVKKNDIVKLAVLRLGSKHKRRFEWKVLDESFKYYFKTFLAVKHIFHSENPKLEPNGKTIRATLKL